MLQISIQNTSDKQIKLLSLIEFPKLRNIVPKLSILLELTTFDISPNKK